MSDLIKATVLKPHMGPDGTITTVGQEIEVDEQRYKALAKKGYVASDEDASPVEAQPVKEGLTNADFQPRRTAIAGSGKTAPKDQAAAKAKAAVKAKRKA